MEEPTPNPHPSTAKKAGIIGGALGTIGIVASIFAFSATASAAGPTLQADSEPAAIEDVDSPEFAAADACWEELEASFKLDEDVDEESIDWEAFETAADACDDLLPEDFKAQIAIEEAAWAPFDECMDAAFADAGIDVDAFDEYEDDFEDKMDSGVAVMDGDELSFAQLGEGDGTITITKSGGDVVVTTDGDVTLETADWDDEFEGEFDKQIDAELHKALSACEDKLPEGFDEEFADELEEFDLSEG